MKNYNSFAKGLFFGEIDESAIFPYPEVEQSERESIPVLLDSLRKFFAENIDGQKVDAEGDLPEKARKGLAELGILGMALPEEYGGGGMSYTAYCRTCEEVSAMCASTATFIGGHVSIGSKAIVLFGTDEQKKKFLPKCATGEWIACYALTEPEAGSDAQNIKTTARRTEDGKHFIINGSKQWITNAEYADIFSVFARVEDERPKGITCFILTRDMPGLQVGKKENKLGLRGSVTNPITLENVKVPAENIIGGIGRGFRTAIGVLDYGRLSLAAGCIGAAKRMIREASAHAAERRQFGRAIGEFELIEKKLWRMTASTYVMESVVYLTSALCDRKAGDFHIESAICKSYASETLWEVINDALQIAGGNGYMKEYPYERFLRDSRINLIFEGTNEIQRTVIALTGLGSLGVYLHGIGVALKNPIKGAKTVAPYITDKFLKSIKRAAPKKVHPALREEANILAEYTKIFSKKAENLVRHYGSDVRDKQFLQERISDFIIDLYCLSATLSRVTRSIETKGEENAQAEIAIAKTFARSAQYRMHKNAVTIDSNDDDLRKFIAKDTLSKRNYGFDYIG